MFLYTNNFSSFENIWGGAPVPMGMTPLSVHAILQGWGPQVLSSTSRTGRGQQIVALASSYVDFLMFWLLQLHAVLTFEVTIVWNSKTMVVWTFLWCITVWIRLSWHLMRSTKLSYYFTYSFTYLLTYLVVLALASKSWPRTHPCYKAYN